MKVRCRDEEMNAVHVAFDDFVNILLAEAGQTDDFSIEAEFGNLFAGLVVPLRHLGESSLDYVNAERVERLGYAELFISRERNARGLLPVAHRRVEKVHLLWQGDVLVHDLDDGRYCNFISIYRTFSPVVIYLEWSLSNQKPTNSLQFCVGFERKVGFA